MAFNSDSLKKLLLGQQVEQMQNANAGMQQQAQQYGQSGGILQNLLMGGAVGARSVPSPRTELGQIMQGAANTYGNYAGNQYANQFKNELTNVMTMQADPVMKAQALAGTIAKYGQDPKDYAVFFQSLNQQMQNAPVPFLNPQTGQPVLNQQGSPISVPRNAKFQPSVGASQLDIEGLTPQQLAQGRSLARTLYGVGGADKGVQAIYDEMKSGKSVDQIQDEIRQAGQSPEFTGAFRGAVQAITIDKPEIFSQKAMDNVDDLINAGKKDQAFEQIKLLARKSAGAEEVKTINGTERTVKLLDEIQGDLNKLEQAGVNTNIFTGKIEQIAGRLGVVRDPELRKVANKILAAIQSYRRSMSGAAFSIPESAEYASLFPGIDKIANFNSANIAGLRDVMSGNLDNFYALSMGPQNYEALKQIVGNQQVNQGVDTSVYGGNPPPTVNVSGGSARVRVKDRNGNIGTIPESQLQDALAQGYQRA